MANVHMRQVSVSPQISAPSKELKRLPLISAPSSNKRSDLEV